MSYPSLDPDLLKALVAVADLRSFTRAAQALNRTQSAISAQIKRFRRAAAAARPLRGARPAGGGREPRGRSRQCRGFAHARAHYTSSPTIAINPFMFSDLTVKPEKDFIPVSIVADTPGLLIANPSFPPNSAKEMVDYVKARPGKINFTSPGSGSLNRLEMETFAHNARLEMTHIPYKGGAGPAVADVMGGHVEVMFCTISSAINHVKEGRLKALGVTTKQRVKSLPDVPTLLEQGFPANVSSSWQGILVPAGTPKPIIDKLFAAVVKASGNPAVQKRMEEAGTIAVSSDSPEEFAQYIAADLKKWADVITITGAKPE